MSTGIYQGPPARLVLGCTWAQSSGWGVPLQYLQGIPEGEDIYDRCLTQAEIQGNINKVNGEQTQVLGGLQSLLVGLGYPRLQERPAWGGGHSRKEPSAQASFRPSEERDWECVSKEKLQLLVRTVAPFAPWGCGMVHPLALSGCELVSLAVLGALEDVDDALERQDAPGLLHALQDPVLALRHLQRDNLDRYLEQLSADREQKALVGTGGQAGAAVVSRREGGSPPCRGSLCGSAAFCKGCERGCFVSMSRIW